MLFARFAASQIKGGVLASTCQLVKTAESRPLEKQSVLTENEIYLLA